MSLPDPRAFSAADRAALAWAVHETRDMDQLGFWPELKWFHDQPCEGHEVIDPQCPRCGLKPRRHQKTAASWQFWAGHTLLADTVGSGKTLAGALTLAMCKETGELSLDSRAVIVVKAAAVRDPWAAALARLLPGVLTFIADGTPGKRERGYLAPWEICVISDRTFASSKNRDGDVETLLQFPVGTVMYDDLDPMGDRTTHTARSVRQLAAHAGRVHGFHGTPLNKRLFKLYCHTEPVGSARVFGTPDEFSNRYVTKNRQDLWITVGKAFPAEKDHWAQSRGFSSYAVLRSRAAEDLAAGRITKARTEYASAESGQARLKRVIWKDNGVNTDRLPEFQRFIAPLVLRRTAADLDDVELPGVQVAPVWLDLSTAQRQRYDELRRGTLTRLKSGGEVEQLEASAVFTRGAQICSGLAALDEDNDDSVKLDYALDLITGDLSDEKVVVYIHFKENVAAFSRRLDEAGVGHVLFWSNETGSQLREARRRKFITDPDCRVLVGTTTIEMSLNLQAARHMIAVDTIMNAARMEQLIGRIRRQGSAWNTVWLHHLLARNTQEDAYLGLLQAEAAMSDAVWGDDSAVFSTLTPRQMLNLVATGAPGQAAA